MAEDGRRSVVLKVVTIVIVVVVGLVLVEMGVRYGNNHANVVAFVDGAPADICYLRHRPGWIWPDSDICEGEWQGSPCKLQYRDAGSEDPWNDAPQYWRLTRASEELRCVCS